MMTKVKKSRAKDLEAALYQELERGRIAQFFKRGYVLTVPPPTWIFHRLKGQRWKWELTTKTRQWEFDFGAELWKLLIEVDGGTFIRSGHTTGTALENQDNKQAEAVARGWRVMRLTRHMIESGVALDLILRATNQGD